jgi:hypothetical protein
MSVVEANITINVPDSVDPTQAIHAIQQIVSGMNGRETHINVVQIDDPLSISPTRNGKWGSEGE